MRTRRSVGNRIHLLLNVRSRRAGDNMNRLFIFLFDFSRFRFLDADVWFGYSWENVRLCRTFTAAANALGRSAPFLGRGREREELRAEKFLQVRRRIVASNQK
jgi:hypothetical protein